MCLLSESVGRGEVIGSFKYECTFNEPAEQDRFECHRRERSRETVAKSLMATRSAEHCPTAEAQHLTLRQGILVTPEPSAYDVSIDGATEYIDNRNGKARNRMTGRQYKRH